jgi:DNA-binding NarL/FixJ family response regulator
MTNVILIVKNEIVRSEIKKALKKNNQRFICYEFQEADAILDLVKHYKLDIIIYDFCFTINRFRKLIRTIKIYQPQPKLLLMYEDNDEDKFKRYLRFGVSGCIRKTSIIEDISKALKLILSGYIYMSQDLFDLLIFNDKEEFNYSTAGPLGSLSSREFYVFIYSVRGQSARELSAKLNLSRSAFTKLQKRIYRKLQVDNLKQLKQIAAEYGYR